jgi:hypothetical protein
MRPAKSVGRIIGMLLLVQLVGLILPFVLLLPLVEAGFLERAAGYALQIRLAVLLLFALGALTIGIAIAAFPLLCEHSYGMALWLLAASVVWFSMQAVDNAHILTMLSLSQWYVEGGASNTESLEALGQLARSSRVWAHYTELLVIEAWFLVFYGLLFRLSLVPRAVAGFGLLMVVVHAVGITMPMFIGYDGVPALGVSLALSHLAVGGWLVAKGFDEGRRTHPPDEPVAL